MVVHLLLSLESILLSKVSPSVFLIPRLTQVMWQQVFHLVQLMNLRLRQRMNMDIQILQALLVSCVLSFLLYQQLSLLLLKVKLLRSLGHYQHLMVHQSHNTRFISKKLDQAHTLLNQVIVMVLQQQSSLTNSVTLTSVLWLYHHITTTEVSQSMLRFRQSILMERQINLLKAMELSILEFQMPR